MPEPPDFKAIAAYSVPPEYVAHVAEQLRQVWNARGAADLELVQEEQWHPDGFGHVIRELRTLDQ